jgi:hypothetical protein
MTMISLSKEPREGDECQCGNGYLVEKQGWLVCSACGGALTNSGKYLPPQSGWAIPALTDEDRNEAYNRLDREETERNFWRQAFS